MRVVIDIECNSLRNPTQIWLVVCKDIDTGERYVFRHVHSTRTAEDGVGEEHGAGGGSAPAQAEAFRSFAGKVDLWIGHNIIGYDLPILDALCGTRLCSDLTKVVDTLILSRLINYSREGGHSIEQYGLEFGMEKGKFSDWTKWSQEMEDYCVRDVDICESVYRKYAGHITSPAWKPAIDLEQKFQLIVNSLHDTGFAFNSKSATSLLEKVNKELGILDEQILKAFPPKEILVREFTPKLTKFGTISRTSVPRSLWDNIPNYEAGKKYRQTKLVDFNPASHKQVIAVLNEAQWTPTDKTQTHINTERELQRGADPVQQTKLDLLKKSGWKINETNLATLPEAAPQPARLLAKRILLESRRRTLTEWLGLVEDDGRIRGHFIGLGAWTHRMAHQKPNTANIPSAFKEDGTPKLLGAEMRSLWRAPPRRLLVGVDAEGIQLRIFAHYINDAEFTDALVRGRKEDKTDPHSLNQRVLGDICRTRQAAKRFVYALLLGGGIGKLSQILECSISECREALDRLLTRYEGFKKLKETGIPRDAKKGFFIGLDGRQVPIPGDGVANRAHLCMSGYLQNGEAIVIKRTALKVAHSFTEKEFFTDIVHDEFVVECSSNVRRAEEIISIFQRAIEEVGQELNLKCPLAGSGGFGLNWLEIH